MGFDFQDRSNHDSKPIYLYQFSLGIRNADVTDFDQLSWYYCNLPSDYNYQGVTYKAASVSDEGLTYTTQTQTNQFKIELPWDSEITQMYATLPPKCVVRVVVRQKQLGDDEAPIYWVGYINGVTQGLVKATIDCVDLISMLSDTSDRTQWTRGCNHTLFDHKCRVDKSKFVTPAVVNSVSGLTIYCPEAKALDKGYFTGGFLEWPRWGDSAVDRVSIASHDGEKLVLTGGYNPMTVGMKIALYPSCDFSKGSGGCARFNNISNYGGFSFMVGQSPYDGSAISTAG